jgi:hypothetical protein
MRRREFTASLRCGPNSLPLAGQEEDRGRSRWLRAMSNRVCRVVGFLHPDFPSQTQDSEQHAQPGKSSWVKLSSNLEQQLLQDRLLEVIEAD